MRCWLTRSPRGWLAYSCWSAPELWGLVNEPRPPKCHVLTHGFSRETACGLEVAGAATEVEAATALRRTQMGCLDCEAALAAALLSESRDPHE